MKQLIVVILLMTGHPSFASGLEAQISSSPDPQRNQRKKCLLINSYHKGYEWSDGIEEAALQVLKGHCDAQVFYMDTKRNNTFEYAKEKGLEAKTWIEAQKPDVVIVADDAAVEHVLLAHFKNKDLKFVFCGVNWEANKYGLPYQNATGMIEVTPVEELVKYIKQSLPTVGKAIFLAGDVDMDRGNYRHYSEIFRRNGISLKASFSKNMADWKKSYIRAQNADVVIIANHAGIVDWSYEQAKETIQAKAQKLSVSNMEFMGPLVAFSLTKLSQEQGDWAGKVAVEILRDRTPVQIPVAVNRRWNLFLNDEVARLSRVRIPEAIKRKASTVSL